MFRMFDENSAIDPEPRVAYNYCNALCDLCKKKPECPLAQEMVFENMLQELTAEAQEQARISKSSELNRERKDFKSEDDKPWNQGNVSFEDQEWVRSREEEARDSLFQELLDFSKKIKSLSSQYLNPATVFEWQMMMTHTLMLPAKLYSLSVHEIPDVAIGEYTSMPSISDSEENELLDKNPRAFDHYLEIQDGYFRVQLMLNALDLSQFMSISLRDQGNLPRSVADGLTDQFNALEQKILKRFGIRKMQEIWWKRDILRLYQQGNAH